MAETQFRHLLADDDGRMVLFDDDESPAAPNPNVRAAHKIAPGQYKRLASFLLLLTLIYLKKYWTIVPLAALKLILIRNLIRISC